MVCVYVCVCSGSMYVCVHMEAQVDLGFSFIDAVYLYLFLKI